MSELVFDHPAWLLLLWLVLPIGAALGFAEQRRRAAALDFAEAPMAARLLPPRAPGRVVGRGACALLAFAALVVAAAGPRFGVFYEPVTERGADLVVLLDVSKSMLSEDVAPNRLERAKSDVRDLVSRVVGHRLGLVAFAGKAVVACPLTTDRAFFKSVLDPLGPRSAPRGGTAIGDALRVGLATLPPQHDRDQALLLITDGEDQDSYPLEAAAVAAERGVKIFTVGLGDPTEGARVPVESEQGGRSFLKHDGQEVWSKMQESLLTELATKTGGAYVPARTRAYDLGEIYEKHLADLATGAIREERRKRLFPQFQLFLALGLAFSLGELLIAPPRRRALALSAALALVAFAAPDARAGDASSDVKTGLALLDQGKVEEALARLDAAVATAPGDARVLYDRGLVKERKLDFDGARADYLAAAAAADVVVARKAQFNLGALAVRRAQAALGDQPEEAEPEKRKDAVARVEEAIRHFRTCLEAEPADAAARQRIESLRVWLKGMQELWAKRDHEKERAKRNALQDLEWLFEQEAAVRAAARALANEADSPLRRAAVEALAARQRDLKDEVPPLQKKLVDEVQKMLGGAAAPSAGGGAPPNAPDPKQVEKIVQSLVQAAESSGQAMAKAATALDAARFDEADAQGKEAQLPLDQLWLSLSSTEATLARGVKLARDVVARNEPLVPSTDAAAPAAAPPDEATTRAAAPRLAESDERLAQTAEVLGPKAQQQLEALEKQPPPAAPPPAPAPNPPPDPNGPPAPPAPPDPELLKKALARTVEVAPQVADLARAAQKALATPDFAASLTSEKEALALLEELEKLFPKPPQDSNQDKNDEKKPGDDKNDKKDEPKGDDSKKDPEKKDEKDGKDNAQPKDRGKSPEMSPDQVQALLRRAAERARQKQQEKRDAEESVLVPVRVDRDW
jgi:Ca-activated chloride channel family protein